MELPPARYLHGRRDSTAPIANEARRVSDPAENNRPLPATYVGLFFVTLATLMHEILLTRIFSVTMWYHFAFIAISVAMFGMTVGAVIVYLRPHAFTPQRSHEQLAKNALWYALSLVVTFLIYIRIPFIPPGVKPDGTSQTAEAVFYMVLSYLVIALPFVFSGIAVSVALTKFPRYVGRLYGADLIGAALGCVALVYTLEITDGPTAVFVVSALAAVGAVAFSGGAGSLWLRRVAVTSVAGLVIFAAWHTSLANAQRPLIRVKAAGIGVIGGELWARWNSFSRVHVSGNPNQPRPVYGWGLSARSGARDQKIPQLNMAVDTWAGTVITRFDGSDTAPLQYLRDDVTNLVHHIRGDSDVVVVGVGGGRDMLSALVFDQRSVTGVEINPNMLRVINEVFPDFAGHLYRHPKVSFHVDEARSWIARSPQPIDIIQISLIDTWAATAAGAFVLTENTLYTAEAWTMFLSRLKPRGVLSVSRWYYPTRPGEAYRLVSLARSALDARGVRDPRQHVLMATAPAQGLAGALENGIVTALVSPDPFSAADLETLRREVDRLGFEVVLDPSHSSDPLFEKILSGSDLAAFYNEFPIDITAPTDDRPFFFQMLRLRDVFASRSIADHRFDPNRSNLRAVQLLGLLLVIVTVLTLLFIIVPLALSRERLGALRGSTSFLAYFLAIGLGFMFIEISQMQRLMVFLGHPTYALTVVLFTLLVSTGLGSLLGDRLDVPAGGARGYAALGTALIVLVGFGWLTPWLTHSFAAATTPVRIALAAGMLFAIGLPLGMPFPLGMRVASESKPGLTPWLWGINGAAGVLCSVLATAASLAWGIAVSFWIGVACYVAALAAFAAARGGELRRSA